MTNRKGGTFFLGAIPTTVSDFLAGKTPAKRGSEDRKWLDSIPRTQTAAEKDALTAING